MKTLDEFERFYENELREAIAVAQRKIEEYDASEEATHTVFDFLRAWLTWASWVFIVTTPFIMCREEASLVQTLSNPNALTAQLILALVLAGRSWRNGQKPGTKMLEASHVQETIKRTVAAKIVSFFGEDFSLEATGQISKETINRSLTFPRAATVAYGEDYVSGTVGDTTVEFSEVILSTTPLAKARQLGILEMEDKEEMMEKMNRYKRDKMAAETAGYFFRGLYFVADFHKRFRGHTLVRPTDGDLAPDDRLETADGSTLGRPEQVHLEDPELESVYNVYGTDQQQARYILSTSLMERIKAFRQRTQKSVFLSFCGPNMHLAVPYSRDLLELRESLSRTELLKTPDPDYSIDRERAFDYFKDLRFILGIVEEFDLNTRIWLKGGASDDDTEGATEGVDTGDVSDSEKEIDRDHSRADESDSSDVVAEIFDDDSMESSPDDV